MHDFVVQYLDFVQDKFSVKTYQEKRFAFQELFKSLDPDLPVDQVHQGDILNHLQVQFKARSGNAANKDRKNLVAAWSWGQRYIKDFPSNNPCKVHRFPETRSPRYIPPLENFWKVYSVAESPQDKLMLLCYLHLAARRKEIFNLRWIDIDFRERQIRLYTRKRKDGSLEYDWLPLTPALQDGLQEHYEKKVCEWVFVNPKTLLPYFERNRWMKRLCLLADVPCFGLHGIRHLTASILTQMDIPLIDIKTILRHKNLATTERYIHRLQSVRSSLDQLPFAGLNGH